MSNNVKIIGLCGAAQSGKDTFADVAIQYICEDALEPELQDLIIAKESFAAPIKSMVAMLLDFFGLGSITNQELLNPYLEGEKKEDTIESIGASPRKLMQTLGTDWGRDLIDNNIWLNSMNARLSMYEEAKKHGHEGALVLITDVRFDNEAQMVRDNGGIIVKIDRNLDDEVAEHVSEAGISEDLIDGYVSNNGSMDDLRTQVIDIVNHVYGIESHIAQLESYGDLAEDYAN